MERARHLLTTLLLLCTMTATAHDFEVGGICYNILTDSTVEVTYKGSSYKDYYHKYSGSVTIPETVTTSRGITYSVTGIGEYAFYHSNSLKSVIIGNNVTRIDQCAFLNCGNLTELTIGNGVTSIGNLAFSQCWSLTGVVIPAANIGSSAFYDCRSLTDIIIGNSVTDIGYAAFADCTGLTDVTIGNGVTCIGGSAFQGCTSLTCIELPNSVVSIGKSAFRNCTALTGIEIPTDVTEIGVLIFAGCTSLESIVVKDGNTRYDSRENCNAIIETATNTLFAGCCRTDIPGSVTSIKYDAFYECGSLASIVIPDGVTSIGGDAFRGCSGLESITIPNRVTNIESNAFYGCSGLKDVTICDGVKSIGTSAFEECKNMETLYLSSTIESIGYCAFAGCNNIFEIKMGSDKAITAYANIFSSDAYDKALLYVPKGAKSAYEMTSPWNNFHIVEMDFTGINDVKGENGTEGRCPEGLKSKVKTIYDLNGRAVENPSDGIYIINGKKVLVK